MELKSIIFDSEKFLVEECYGFEYDGKNGRCCAKGFPFKPLRYHKLLDNEHAYIVDSKGIVWILENGLFSRPCLRWCLDYIFCHDKDMKGGKASEIFEIIGVRDSSNKRMEGR